MDLVDAILNRELQPQPYSGRDAFFKPCVACWIGHTGNLEGLPKEGSRVDHLGMGYVVYWPDVEWTPGVQEYVDTAQDSSGIFVIRL